MNPFRILLDYLRRWFVGLLARRKSKRGKRSQLLQRERYSLNLVCEYFVSAGDEDFSFDNVYLGWSPATDSEGVSNSLRRCFADLRYELPGAPSEGLLDGDEEYIRDITVTRIFNGLRLQLAPRVQGEGVWARPEANEDCRYYLYRLDSEGQLDERKKPRRLRRQALYILMENNYMLTDEGRNFTLKFCCSEKCQWLLPVS